MASKEGGNVSVVARFRPLNEREKKHSRDICVNFSDDYTCEVSDKNGQHSFTFDRVFSINATQAEVYQYSAKPIVESVLEGFNGTVFAYGQTGSGKTFTMSGSDIYDPQNKGIIPRMIRTIFEKIENSADNIEFTMKVGYCEIYLEKIKDLLNPTKTDLKIKEDQINGVYIADQRMEYVSSELEVFDYMQQGMSNREVGATQMNAGSSRSHSIFNMVITQTEVSTYSSKSGKLYMVDLAGSEKIAKTGAEGKRLDEAKNINKSLTMLGMVINALTDKSSTHIPYRDSKLTRVLQDSLGGNSKTTLIITCSPSSFNDQETLGTLRFGLRAKKIKNTPTINKEQTVAELKLLLEKAETDLKFKDDKISLLELAIKKLQGQEVDEIEIQKILPQQKEKKQESSDEEKSLDILDYPEIEEEIRAEFEALQEQLEQQKAITESEASKAQQFQRDFYALQVKYLQIEKEADALLMRCQTLQMTSEDLEYQLQDKEMEIQQVMEENQKLKTDFECVQTLNQAPPLQNRKSSIRKIETKEQGTQSDEVISQSQEPIQMSQQENSALIQELKDKIEQLQQQGTSQVSEGQNIESIIEKIRQEERKDRSKILRDLENRVQKVVELEMQISELQEKFDQIWACKGDKELKQKQVQLEQQNQNLSKLYHQNIRKISEIRVKKKLQKKQLARKDDKIQQLTKQLNDLQVSSNDLKKQLEQALQNPLSGQQDLPSVKSSKGVVKKIKGGSCQQARNINSMIPVGHKSATFQSLSLREEQEEEEESES